MRPRLIGALAVVGIALCGATPTAAQEEATDPPGRVLIVSMPRLVWQDVADLAPPNLVGLLEQSAVASLSVRAIGPRTDLGEGYVTLGAGNRARAQRERAGDAVDADEPIGPNTGAELYEAVTGADAGDAAVLSLAVGDAVADADRLLYGAVPGALGQALADAGLRGAVVANADGGPPAGGDERHREAALAMMDEQGRVAEGTVGRQLSVVDVEAPGGRRVDPDAVLAAVDAAWEAGSSAVLVEMSDLERADRNGLEPEGSERLAGLAAPLAEADELLGRLLEGVDIERDRVLVVSPAAPGNFGRLTAFAMTGRDVEPGRARSATTRRDGFVTLPDVGATVLDSLELEVPADMNATAITSAGGEAFTVRDAAHLADDDEIARFRDRTVGPVSVVYIVLQVVTYGLAALALVRRSTPTARAVALAALTILATPPVAFLSGLFRYDRLPLALYVVAVFVLAMGIALMARSARRIHPFAPALALATLNWLLQVVDVVLGGRLQLSTPFGYSPIVAGRFQGLGNLAFAILASSAIVVATGAPGLQRRTWPPNSAVGYVASRRFLAWAAGVLGVTFLVDGLPPFGADVGGVLAMVPAFALVLVLLAGWRVSIAKVVVVGLVTVAAVAGLALVDLARPEEQRTHLGRFAQRLTDGDAGLILRRKVEANISILTSSVWTWLVPVCLAFLAFLALRRTGYLHRLQRRVPGVRAGLLGALVAGTFGFALNDSGVAVPAMMFGIVLPWVIWMLLSTELAT